MSDEQPINPLVAQRQLSFLTSFDKKFEGFRREMERLERAAGSAQPQGGRWPTEGLERIARSLVGAGAVYNLPSITDWAREFLARLDSLRTSQQAPTREDFGWLAERISALGELQERALEEAGGTATEAEPDTASRKTPAPYIAPSRATDPPPPPDAAAEAQPVHAAVPRPSGVGAPPPDAAPKRSDPPPLPARSEPPAPAPSARPEAPADAVAEAAPATSAPAVPSSERTPSVQPPPLPTASMRGSVLVVVQDTAIAEDITSALDEAGFDAQLASSPHRGLERATSDSPDLIVVDLDDVAPGGIAFLQTLARDPLTDFIPVLRIGEPGVRISGAALPKPLDLERLVVEARRLVAPDLHVTRVVSGLRDPNLGELMEFVAHELRTGVSDAVTGPHTDERFRVFGEGALMASIWGLVAQLRRTASQGSNGKIRFVPASSGRLGMMALAEAEEVLDSAGNVEIDEADLEDLARLRVVVADDDPEIRVVFDKVLSEAGMKVRTAADGIEALGAIRENKPDVVISDILMPGLDGWELCNRMRADYALRQIPVIVLSWKEDFLERLRGLNMGADDFMLKEIDRQQILSRLIRVLRPRLVLQRQLGISGDVTGRVDRIGVQTIIEAVMAKRPSCRITFRESWNYFEVDIRDGELIAVTATGTDGSFASGPRALERLLGISSGRFAVVAAIDTPRQQFKDGTHVAIQSACRRMNGLVAQVIDGALLDIAKVELDDEVLELYGQIMPPKLRLPLERLRSADSPREIILAQSASPDALETLLLDLVRVGAIKTIHAPPPDLSRTPMARDSARWRAVGEGKLIDADDLPPPPPRRRSSPLPFDDFDEPGDGARAGTRPPALQPLSSTGIEARVGRGWQVLALIAVIALGFSLYFNYRLWPGLLGDGAVAPAPEAPRPEPATPEPPEVARVDEPPADVQPLVVAPAPEVQPEPEVQPAPEVAPEPEAEPAPKKEPEITTEPEPKKEPPPKKEPEPSASAPDKVGATGGSSTSKPKKEPEPKKEPAATSGTGTLVIGLPDDAEGPIQVLVDGKAKGAAPTRIELAPGLHEITFVSGGKRSLRMVSIKAGGTKNVTAKVPK